MSNYDIVVIADTQVGPDSPTDHLHALSKYIWKHKPSDIVHIGDHWDLASLSLHASALELEGRRLYQDLEAVFNAFRIIDSVTKEKNAKGKRGAKKAYDPNKHFLEGNHEKRLSRYIQRNPVLEGCFDLNSFVADQGWEVYEMNDPLWLYGIAFSHYMENPQSGRAMGGSMENKLNKIPHSFVHGHQQQYQFARRQNLLGKPHFGACAGSFYMHDEDYRGANNTEVRGFLHLKGYTNRFGYIDHDVEFVSLERLLDEY